MAGDWIKIEKDTPDKPEVLIIANLLGKPLDEVMGILVRFWRWVDSHMAKCDSFGVTKKNIDEISKCAGFASSMEKAGWLVVWEGGITIPNFEYHLSQSAKRRALTNKRMQNLRDAHSVTSASPEKRREEERYGEEVASAPSLSTPVELTQGELVKIPPGKKPPSDLEELRAQVEVWNQEVAPVLHAPTVRDFGQDRQRSLRARLKDHPNLWAEILAENSLLGERFRLEGSWINFDFFMKPKSLAKWLEGNYRAKHNQGKELGGSNGILGRQETEEDRLERTWNQLRPHDPYKRRTPRADRAPPGPGEAAGNVDQPKSGPVHD